MGTASLGSRQSFSDREGEVGHGRREWLLVRTPQSSETRVEIVSPPLRIGRGSGSGLVLQDTYASAAHAELVEHEGGTWVRDLGSRNGTRLNGRTLQPGSLHVLRDRDVLQIGSSELTYRCEPRPERADVDQWALPAGEDWTGRAATGEPAWELPPAELSRSQPAAWRGRIGRIVAYLLLASIVATGLAAGVIWALAPARVALVALGGDARPDELRRGQPGRTDTLLAVVADRSPAGIVLISVPRDVWVQVPGFGGERINAAYALGGEQAVEQAVSDVLGARVDRHLLIGLQGVRDVVDAVGGVEIDVERPIHDVAYPTDDYGTIVVDIPAGRQRMDGEMALRYVRSRAQDTDFGRMARQQRLVVALRSALLQPRTWPRLPAAILALRRATQTDLGPLELATLGMVAIGGSGEPERLAIDFSLVDEFSGPNGEALLRPRPALRQRVAALLAPLDAAVVVLNGTQTPGLAKQAAERLRDGGMRRARFDNAARPPSGTTVEVRPGFRRAGLHAASILELSPAVVRESLVLPEGVDVRITLGDGRNGATDGPGDDRERRRGVVAAYVTGNGRPSGQVSRGT